MYTTDFIPHSKCLHSLLGREIIVFKILIHRILRATGNSVQSVCSVRTVWRRADLPFDWTEQEFTTQNVQMPKILTTIPYNFNTTEYYITTNALLYAIIYYSKMFTLKHLKTLQHD